MLGIWTQRLQDGRRRQNHRAMAAVQKLLLFSLHRLMPQKQGRRFLQLTATRILYKILNEKNVSREFTFSNLLFLLSRQQKEVEIYREIQKINPIKKYPLGKNKFTYSNDNCKMMYFLKTPWTVQRKLFSISKLLNRNYHTSQTNPFKGTWVEVFQSR